MYVCRSPSLCRAVNPNVSFDHLKSIKCCTWHSRYFLKSQHAHTHKHPPYPVLRKLRLLFLAIRLSADEYISHKSFNFHFQVMNVFFSLDAAVLWVGAHHHNKLPFPLFPFHRGIRNTFPKQNDGIATGGLVLLATKLILFHFYYELLNWVC